MLKTIFLLITIAIGSSVFAQQLTTIDSVMSAMDSTPSYLVPTDSSLENTVFTKVETEAEFVGGQSAWAKYLQRNLNPNTPIDNGAPRGKYVVIIQFVVSKDGTISEIEPLTTQGYGMEKEVIRIIKMGPKWKPAMQNGRVVNAYRRQPITFVVQEK